MRKIHKYTTTITVSGGSGTRSITGAVFRVISDSTCMLLQALVKAPEVKDTFDFNITDEDDFTVYSKEKRTGKLNDTTEVPLLGDIDLNIANASRDGSYSVKIIVREVW